MKANQLNTRIQFALAVLAGILAAGQPAQASTIVKTNNATALNVAGSWTNNAVPGAGDIAQWDNTVSDGNNTTNVLGGSLSWSGVRIVNPAGAVVITTNAGGNNLTVGAAGIDLSAASVNLTMSNNLIVPDYTVEGWTVPTGLTLALAGAYTRSGGSGLTINNNGTINVAGGTASTTLYYALVNGTDIGALDASKNLSTVNSVFTYTGNVLHGVPTTGYCDVVNANTGTLDDVYLNTTIYYPQVIRFNTPQPNRSYWSWNAYKGQVSLNTGATAILVTTNVGACDVFFSATGSGGITVGWRQSGGTGSELIVDQENTAGSIYFNGSFSQKSAYASNMLTKRGAGRAVFNIAMQHNGPTRVLQGEMMVNSTSMASSIFTVNSGATLSGIGTVTGTVTNNGILWPGTNGLGTLTMSNLTLNAGSAVNFYAAKLPTTNTAALLNITNAVTVNGAVNVSILSGKAAAGQYPLIKATAAFSSAAFANFALVGLPPHVFGYLSNNTAALTIDLVITNIAEPLSWATGSDRWNTNYSSIWQTPLGAATTYQEAAGAGDSVLFPDTLSAGSSITVTMTSALVPASTIFSNNTDTYTLAGAGGIVGSGSFTKTGSGLLLVNNTNTFNGGLGLNSGILKFTTSSNLGAGAITFGGGTLQYASGNTADISAQTVTLAAGGGTIDDGGNTLVYANPIGNSGAGGLTKAGAGSLTLTGTNKYSGITLIASGTLALAASSSISNSAALIVNGGAVLDASTSGVGLTLGGGTAQVVAGTGTIEGTVISSNGVITPGTNGVVGTLTFANDLTLTGGALVMDLSTNSAQRDLLVVGGNLTIYHGSTLQLNVTGTLTNGIYKLIKYGNTTLASGAGSSANLTILGYSQTGKSLSLSDATANEIDLVVADSAADSISWSGAGGGTWDLAGSQNWLLHSVTAWAYTNGDFVTFDNLGASASSVSLLKAVTPSSIVVSNDQATYDFSDGTATGGGQIAGTTSIIKAGAGTLIVETANVNSGALVISNGTVQIGNGSTGDLGSGNVTNNGALVFSQGSGASHLVAGQISGSGSVTQQGSDVVILAANNSYAGPTTISSGTLQVGNTGATGALGTNAVANNGVLTFNRTGSLTVPNVITGSGSLAVYGGATITLAGTNDYTGATTVSSGKLIEGQAGSLGGAGSLVVQAAGTNDLNGHDLAVTLLESSSSGGGRIVNNAGTGTNTLTINYAGTGSADSSIVIADNDGSGGKIQLVMNGSATQIIRSANTYSGGTIINSGALQARQANTAFGAGTNVILNGGTLDNYGSTLTYAITVTTNSSLYSAANCYFNGPFYGASNLTVTLAGSVTSGETISWGTANQLAGYSGLFTCGVDAETYGRFWRWANAANTTNGSATAGWDLEGNVTMTVVNTGCIIYLGLLEGSSLDASVNGNNTTYLVGGLNANTTYSGNVYGTGSFVKVGMGTLTLNSADTFYGSTVVSNGVLALTGNAAITNSSTIAIRAGAVLDVSGMIESFDGVTFQTNILTLSGDTTNQTLTGSGTLMGSVVADANSTINPGDGIGTLTVTTNITLGGVLLMELNRTNNLATNDMLVAGGTITGGGTLTVTNLGPALQGGDTFKLFSAAVSGFTATTLPALTGSMYWTNRLAVNGSIQVINPIATNPTNITFSVNGTSLALSWPSDHLGWTLQMQTNSLTAGLGTNWVDVAGSAAMVATNITVNPGLPTVFYRLRQ